MKLILAEFEGDAIKYCFDLISSEQCLITIVHESEINEWGNSLCQDALVSQKKWEVYRAYKDIREDHKVEYLGYQRENYEQILVTYLQLKVLLGFCPSIYYPEKYTEICEAILGKVSLNKYNKDLSNLQALQEKALSRFKLIKI